MTKHDLFLSVVVVVRNEARVLPELLREMETILHHLVTDYELIVIDNASNDETVLVLRQLTAVGGLPNLQVFVLTKEVEPDLASWAGVENSLGDYVVVIDPTVDDPALLPDMLDQAFKGYDVVFSNNILRPPQSLSYSVIAGGFRVLYRWLSGVDIVREAPMYRLLSRRVVNYAQRFPAPGITYRSLPATAGFPKITLTYKAQPHTRQKMAFRDGISGGMRLLVSTTHVPMRLVTLLCLFGAGANVVYTLYVIAIALHKEDVAPGWITLSLQQSGMFFLISLVLLILGEYILHMAYLSNEGPRYDVAQEFTSAVISRRERLNVEERGGEPTQRPVPH